MEKTLNTNPVKRDIKYTGRDFDSFRNNLMEFAKTYFPNTYQDYTPVSPGVMYMELMAYTGDVLSFYMDYIFKENLLLYAAERKNIIALAKFLGYKIKPAAAATTDLDIYQLIPSINNGSSYEPDWKYALNIKEQMQISSTDSATFFLTTEPVNFAEEKNRTVSIFERDSDNTPLFYLVKKLVSAKSGRIVTREYTVGAAAPFYSIKLPENNVLEILEVKDADNNRYYEVPFLAQDMIFTNEENSEISNPDLARYKDTTPYVLKLLKVPRRFVASVDVDSFTTLEFGAGISDAQSEEIIVPSTNALTSNVEYRFASDVAYDPANLLGNKTYGQAPANTTLTVKYIIGGGLESNINANELTTIGNVVFNIDDTFLTPDEQLMLNSVKRSLTVNNSAAAVGGKGADSDEEIRQNALGHYAAQNRAVTRNDYIVRAYSMPPQFGSVAKAYVTPDGALDERTQLALMKTLDFNEADVLVPTGFQNISKEINNPFAINLYILSYNKNQKLTTANPATVQNLKNYIGQYRMLTDGLNILSGFIINVGVDFSIAVYKNYDKKEVLANCITRVKNFFDITKWQFNQPINITELQLEMSKTDGVQSIAEVKIKNLNVTHGDYSENEYDIKAATINNIVYPSLDPSVFEVKFPNKDIVGRTL